jgi:hypothetical protein
MERFLIILLSSLLLFSCKNETKEPLELSILNKNLVAYSYGSYKDTLNIIEYCIENKSDTNFFINDQIDENSIYSEILFNRNSVYKNRFMFKFYYDKNNKEVEYDKRIYSRFKNSNYFLDSIFTYKLGSILTDEYFRLYSDEHNVNGKNISSYYSHTNYDKNYFIPAGEKVYGKLYLNITDTMAYEDHRIIYAKLYSDQNYYTKMLIISDTTNYLSKYPNHILKRIKDNNYKVYHGIIESKEKVSVKVIN